MRWGKTSLDNYRREVKGMRSKSLSVAVVVLLLMVFSVCTVLAAGISGTKHDLSSSRDDKQVCVFCHVPHNPVDKTLLWARAVPTGSFDMYSNSTLDGEISGELSGTASLLCMSCHDGVTAIDITFVNADAKLGGIDGKDLTNDHPVNIVMALGDVPVDPGLKMPSEGGCVLFGKEGDPQKVQCASCHNVHGQSAELAGVTDIAYQDDNGNIAKFLRVTPQGSGICLDCHVK